MQQKHNLDLHAAEDAVQRTIGFQDGNTGHWTYEDAYRDVNGKIVQYVLINESRGKNTPPDGHEVGLITGYCQGANHSFEAECPEWVNESL